MPPKTALLRYPFYQRDTVGVARDLLGKYMVYDSEPAKTGGIVVETEAYLGAADPACHSAAGKSRRNQVMFGPSGFAYIYLIYGVHFCFNVTTGSEDSPEAVLIRALEPVEGIETMRANRGREDIRSLCSGPGKLVQAMGIGPELNGSSVVEGPVRFFEREGYCGGKIEVAQRVGISKASDWPLRFYLSDSKFVSKK